MDTLGQEKNNYIFVNVRPDGKCINDCYIRAIVLATDINYENVEKLFLKKQLCLNKNNPNDKEVVFSVLKDLGFVQFETINHNTNRGSMKISTFLLSHKEQYIIYTGNHIAYAENGIVFDTWNCTNCLLCGYFSKNHIETNSLI